MAHRQFGSGNKAPNVNEPKRFRCKVCHEWNPLSSFSDNQRKYLDRQRAQGSIDAANSGMTCRKHNGVREEFACDVCRCMLPRDAFSKRALRDDEHICKMCTSQVETVEPGEHMLPHRSERLLPREIQPETWQTQFMKDTDCNVQGDTGSEIASASLGDTSADGSDYGFASGSQSVSLESGSDLEFDRLTIFEATRVESKLPSHLSAVGSRSSGPTVARTMSDLHHQTYGTVPQVKGRGPQSNSSVAGQQSATNSIANKSSSIEIPPHLSSRGPRSISTATTTREEAERARAAAQVSYNAWDSAGIRHDAVKNPTQASSTDSSSVVSSTRNTDRNVIGDWPEPASTVPLEFDKSGRWAKAPRMSKAELRLPMPNENTRSKVSRGVDWQRPQNYCGSDDNDYL